MSVTVSKTITTPSADPQSFRSLVEQLVSNIPKGQVMTYGQIAALCGSPRAARIVGGVAHYGDPDLPWHRVVNKQGGLASGYPGGRINHKEHLAMERIEFDSEHRLAVDKYLWQPSSIDEPENNAK